ncbi:hypothetical protein H8356DRAFT_1429563 [Neocallimastix lanati (nom. inval.)]|nr:hypothetical protein H8356DRAFT_1429563 [Neocallimastix sp. JGI-2020a]
MNDLITPNNFNCYSSKPLFFIILFSRFLGFGLLASLVVTLFHYLKDGQGNGVRI